MHRISVNGRVLKLGFPERCACCEGSDVGRVPLGWSVIVPTPHFQTVDPGLPSGYESNCWWESGPGCAEWTPRTILLGCTLPSPQDAGGPKPSTRLSKLTNSVSLTSINQPGQRTGQCWVRRKNWWNDGWLERHGTKEEVAHAAQHPFQILVCSFHLLVGLWMLPQPAAVVVLISPRNSRKGTQTGDSYQTWHQQAAQEVYLATGTKWTVF